MRTLRHPLTLLALAALVFFQIPGDDGVPMMPELQSAAAMDRQDAPRPATEESGGAQGESAVPTPEQTDARPEPPQATEEEEQEEGEDSTIRETSLPEGFEAWEEPQTTAMDIYYGGEFRLTALAEYTLGWVRFFDPRDVVDAIPGLADREKVLEALSGRLDAHAEEVCAGPDDAGCGFLDPDVAAIIFDETRFRVDLFVNRSLLTDPERERTYLPAPEHQSPTLVQNLSATYAGSSTADNRFSLFGRTRAGRGAGHGFANWVSTDRQSLSFDEAGYHHDFLDHELRAGLFEPQVDVLRALRRQPILGASVARSMNSRRDRDAVISNPIELFLPNRSRVDIFRDERLVSSGFYEAGNREIDTGRLPAGAYEIDIVITDVDGNVRTERQLFVKSTVLAPPGESLWFAEAGRIMQRNPRELSPDRIDEFLTRGGYRWRQYDWLGLGLAGAATTEAALGEASAHFLYPGFQAGGEVFSSTEGGWGYGLRGSGRLRELTVSLGLRRTHADTLPEANQDEDSYRLLPTDQSLRTVQLSHPLGRGQLLATGSESRRPGGERFRRASLRYRHTTSLGGGQSLSLSVELGTSDGDRRLLFGARWRMRHNQWTHSANVQARDSQVAGETDGLSAGVASNWRDGERFVDDIEAGVRADFERERRSLGGRLQHRSQFGQGRATVTGIDGPSGDQRALGSFGYDTSVVMDRSGTARPGGPDPGESGVLLDLTGIPDGLFDVIINGQRQFTARGGRMAVVTLPAYEQYRIRLADRGLDMVRFDEEPRTVTLYPGNVVSLEWDLRRVNVLVGRAERRQEVCLEHVDECYQVSVPLGDARIEGVEGFAFTDPDGFFQADVREGVKELQARYQGESCRISLEGLEARHGVIRAGELQCVGEEEEAVIDEERVNGEEPLDIEEDELPVGE